MKKIIFGITSLNIGGAERVLVDIANELVKKYDITIFTLYGEGDFTKELNKEVKVISMFDTSYNKLSKFTRLRLSIALVNPYLRKKIYDKYINNNYDIEIAFLEGPITWIFSTPSRGIKIAWVHNDIENVFLKDKQSKKKQELNKECYKKYQRLVFVSQDNLSKFQNYFPDNKVSKQVIYNYLNSDLVIRKANKGNNLEINKDTISFVQVSRLVNQKGIDRLIKVHHKLINEGLKHTIYIVGDGPLRNELQSNIDNLNIGDTFKLLGAKENPYPYINGADYFLLSSYYEGYGMVLVEAKILNKYIIITDTAAREALINYPNSKILPNTEEGIYQGLKEIILNKPKVMKTKFNQNKEILKEIIKLLEGE